MHSVFVTTCWVLLVCTLTLVTSAPTSESSWPKGDPNRCLELIQRRKPDIELFGVIPGLGWDNLRNVEAGQVVKYTFNKCKLSNDGRYLLPDNVLTVPLKTSQVEQFAELIDQRQNTSTLTARTVNLETGLSFTGSSISGKYSKDNIQLKAKQIEQKALTARVKLQYNKYEAKLDADAPLSKQFKSRLMEIASQIRRNHSDIARYEAQLVVRDFGTHYLTAVTAGAALVKDDFLNSDYVFHSRDKEKILASASFSFFEMFNFSSKLKINFKPKDQFEKESSEEEYNKSLTFSHTRALGGPKVMFDDITVKQWSEGVDSNLVPMDRAGDPLYYLITPQMLPDLSEEMAFQVAEYVRRAVEVYYEMNVIRGCTQQGSSEFSPLANLDDGSCSSKPTPKYFGGFFQNCSSSGEFEYHDPCNGLSIRNPRSGYQYSCPTSYTQVKIFQGSQLGAVESKRMCTRSAYPSCVYEDVQATANYETYWCVAEDSVHPESGYLFGGVYTSNGVNLVTGEMHCPSGFESQTMVGDLRVCMSDDFESSVSMSVPFGGFFSCQEGNPLAGSDPWPARCPNGYSQYLATVVQDCEIFYCLESRALSSTRLPPVKRPPFMLKPALPMTGNQNQEDQATGTPEESPEEADSGTVTED